jgi:hypothetical protein
MEARPTLNFRASQNNSKINSDLPIQYATMLPIYTMFIYSKYSECYFDVK